MMMISGTILKSLVVVLMFVCMIRAADTGKKDDKGLLDCSSKEQLMAASNMCMSHSKPNNHIACVCQESMPVCLAADMTGSITPSICSDKTYEACVDACATSVIAVKCEGTKASKCVTADAKVKKHLLSQI